MNDYTPVMGDLGLIMEISPNPKSKIYAGTPLYMGSEAYHKSISIPLYNCKADIFALGVTFY